MRLPKMTLLTLAGLLGLLLTPQVAPAQGGEPGAMKGASGDWVAARIGTRVAGRIAGWVADSSDSICGLSKTKTLSSPAKIDYDKALAATAEMKRIKSKGISETSAEGRILKKAAEDKVRSACQDVMKAKKHCSVWKKISHSDPKKKATDITDAVIDKIKA